MNNNNNTNHALVLSNEGYIVKTKNNHSTGKEATSEGITNLYAEKTSGELVKVNVVNKNLSDWFLIKLAKANHPGKIIRIDDEIHDALMQIAKSDETYSDVIKRLLMIVQLNSSISKVCALLPGINF